MGARLADRLPTGVRLTAAGLELFSHAERMEAEAKAADLRLSGVDEGPAGTVRLATPEAFGTFLVAPNIRSLHERYPGLPDRKSTRLNSSHYCESRRPSSA